MRYLLAAGALTLALALTGCSDAPAVPQPVPTTTAPAAPAAAQLAATSVRVSSIGVDSDLIPLGLAPDRSMQTPDVNDPGQAGVYTGAPVPGAVGPAIIAGHVNGGGRPGVFARLADLQPGAEVLVARSDGQTAVFRVTRVDTVDKDEFPTAAVYGDTATPQLRLITCGGALNRAAHSYESNVVAYAELVDLRPTS